MIRQRIAVIGGVAAGPAAAAHAKRIDPDADVILFEKGSHISYGACEMPYYIADQIESADTLVIHDPESFQREKSVAVFAGHDVTDVHPSRNRLVVRELASGRSREERFDKFIFATGASAIRPDIQGSDADNLFTVRCLADAIGIKNYMSSHRVRHAIILGGGYIGLEMAEAMVRRQIRTTVLEPGSGLLNRYVSPALREYVQDVVHKNGVQVRSEKAVRFDVASSGAITSVGTDSGETIGCQLVIAAMGTRPNTELARRAGLRITETGTVEVDPHMRTSAANVWACGDCVEVERIVDGRKISLPLSQTAFRTARVAAENAARRGRGQPAKFPGVCGASAVKVFGLEVARAGLSLDEARAAGFDAFVESVDDWSRVSFYPGAQRLHIELVVDRRNGRLLGGAAVGTEGAALRVNVLVPLIWKGWLVSDIRDLDLIYAPPLAPSLDPLLVAANRAVRGIRSTKQ
ncbi:MAG: FAD-dependent oxidoreductase [Rhodothermales bacterium]|nr:FAD-dependent oxidoreductase [Rhodothermales bacterium]